MGFHGSNKVALYVTVIALMYGASPVAAQRPTDRVRLARGYETGEFAYMTPLEVTLNKRLSCNRSIAVN
jgi:hypothetical protein